MKKYFAYILFSILIFSFCACKKDQAPEDLPAIETHTSVDWVKQFNCIDSLVNDFNIPLMDMIILPDGGAILLIAYPPQITMQPFIRLLRVNAEGAVIYCKEILPAAYSGQGISKVTLIDAHNDGLILSFIFGNYFSVVIKTDYDGNFQWEKVFDFWPDIQIFSVLERQPSGYYCFGSDSSGNIILTLDDTGDTLRCNRMSTSFYENFITVDYGNNFFVCAGSYADFLYNHFYSGHIMAMDSSGTEFWSAPAINIQYSGAPFFINSIYVTDYQYVLATGYYGDYTTYYAHTFFVYISQTGNIQRFKLNHDLKSGCWGLESAPGGFLVLTGIQKQIAMINEHCDLQWCDNVADLMNVGSVLKRIGNKYYVLGQHYDQLNDAITPVLVKFELK